MMHSLPSFPYHVTDEQQQLVVAMLKKFSAAREGSNRFSLITHDELYAMCDEPERTLLDAVLTVEPSRYGVDPKHLGFYEPEDSFVAISGQRYRENDQELVFPPLYMPQHTYDGYLTLKQACFDAIGRQLLVCAAYRSPAFQQTTFLTILKVERFLIEPTVRRVALPGYSQHGYPPMLAVDFLTEDGLPSMTNPIDFEETPEFEWLLANANHYGWYLSYPRGNDEGLMYEPWHWQYRGISS